MNGDNLEADILNAMYKDNREMATSARVNNWVARSEYGDGKSL